MTAPYLDNRIAFWAASISAAWRESVEGILDAGRLLIEAQKELLDAYQAASQAWVARVKSECDLWSDLAARLREARTLPDGLSACQRSLSERIKLAAEDGQRLLNDGQKFASAMTHSLSSTWPKTGGN